MRVGAVLEDAVHAGDQRDLPPHLVQRSQGRRERQGVAAGRDGLSFETPDVVLSRELRQRPVIFSGEEASTRYAIWQLEKSQPLCRRLCFAAQGAGIAFEPGQAEGGTTGTRQKIAARNGSEKVFIAAHLENILR